MVLKNGYFGILGVLGLLVLIPGWAWCAEGHAEIQIFSPAMSPENSPEYFDALAELALQNRDYLEACRVYDQALKRYPRDARLRNNAAAVRDAWADAALARKSWETALEACENALAASLLPEHFMKKIAYILQEGGRDAIRAHDTLQLETWLTLGRKRFSALRFVNPLISSLYAEALDALPIFDQRLYLNQGVELLESYQRVQGEDQVDASMVKTWCDRILHDLVEKKAWEDSILILQAAREFLPRDAYLRSQEITFWNARAQEYIRGKQWALATLIYEQALERFPQESLFQNNLKYCQQKRDQTSTTVQ